MKVSACIITYNHEKFIRDCLDGALNQIVDFDYEIVIGEDKSTDRTLEICKEYATKFPDRVRLRHRTENLGMIGNWNQTIKDCKGKYIAICEGDDYWTDPFKLQKQVDFLEAQPTTAMVYTKANMYSETKKLIINEIGGPVKNYHDLLEFNPIPTLTVVFRKSMYDSIREIINGSDSLLADLYLWLQLSCRGEMGFIDEVTAVYRVLPESASQSADVGKQIRFMEAARKVRISFLESIGAKEFFSKVDRMHYIKTSRLRLLPNHQDVSQILLHYFKNNNLKSYYVMERIKTSFTFSKSLLNILYSNDEFIVRILNKIIR